MNKFKFQADVIGELHPLFKGLQWVCAARSTDEARYVLNLINVEREGLLCKIVATDGKRLHVHTFDPGMFDDDIQMIQPGLYEVIAKSGKLVVIADPEDSLTYPNWRNVMPDHEATIHDLVTASSIGKIGIRTGVLLATDFTMDAIGFKHGRGKDDSVAITYGHGPDKGGAFLIEHDLGTAVVMPLRMEDSDKDEVEATPFMNGFPKPETKAGKKPAADDGNTPDMLADPGPRIVDAEENDANPTQGWTPEVMEDVLVDLIEGLNSERFDTLENIFADGTAEPFLDYMLKDARPSALLKQMARRAAIRGDVTDCLRDSLVSDGAKQAMRKLEKTGSVKAITAAAKNLIALLVPKDLAEFDLLLEGGCVLPLGVRNLIRKATDTALADAELEETQPEGAEADY